MTAAGLDGLTRTETTLVLLLPPQPAMASTRIMLRLNHSLREEFLAFITTRTPNIPSQPLQRLERVANIYPGNCPVLRSLKNFPRALASERSAHGEAECRGRFEIVQAPRIVLNQINLRLDLELENRGIQIGSQKVYFAFLDKRRLRHNGLVQAMNVVRIINSERSLHDWQPDHKFDTRRTAQAEIGSRFNRQLGTDLGVRELANQAHRRQSSAIILRRQRRRIEFQPAAVQYPVGAAVKEQRRLNR